MSRNDSPALSREASSSQWAADPCATPIFLPFRSATVRIDDVLGTTMPSADCVASMPAEAATILMAAPDDWAKIGGASPTPPMSTAPALIASNSGGPAAKLLHSILYGRSLS